MVILQKKNIKEHNPNWRQIPDHPYRLLIIAGSRSEKTNKLSIVLNYQPDIDKSYLYAEDNFETKYQLLINKRECTNIKHFNNSEAFIE